LNETRSLIVNQKSIYEDILVMREEHRDDPRLGKSLFPTEVMITDDETGEIIHHGHNMTVLGGRTFLLEQFFGIPYDSTKHLFLNTMLGIPHSLTNSVMGGGQQRSTSYFMIGDGASNQAVPGRYYNPKNYETKLYHPMPFRCVKTGNDLTPTVQANYRFKKLLEIDGDNYYAYYAKKFQVSTLLLEYNNAVYVPVEGHTRPVNEGDSTHELGGGSVLSYVQFTMTVDKEEFKEYYRLTPNNMLDDAQLDEFGLVLGASLPDPAAGNHEELAAAELATKFTSAPSLMTSESSRRSIVYRIYS
jgi:hypothetical protein